MAERNNTPLSSLSSFSFHHRGNWLFCCFSIISVILLVSWFFVLQSTWFHPSFRNQFVSNVGFSNHNDRVEVLVGGECSNAGNSNDLKSHLLKVYMYDLPHEFHFGILDWKPDESGSGSGSNVWPDIRKTVPHYPGGLNLQHSLEYWLTLDLLFSDSNDTSGVVLRVQNSSEADVVFVPFFSSLSYNRFSRVIKDEKMSRDRVLQDKLVKYLEAQDEWKRSGGVDHIILAHHPNSLSYARNQLWPAMFLLSDFGRYPPNIANVNKDVIAPYRHVIKSFDNDTSSYETRPILLYFQGAILRKDGGVIRQELFHRLKDEKDVHFAFGSVQHGGINNATLGMHASKFCLNIAGDTPSSNRLFDAIASHCVPVIISDDIELPFEDVIDYSEFSIFVSTVDAVKDKFLINLISGVKREEWTRMWNKLQQVKKYFEFRYPSKGNDAVQMVWQTVARKVPAIKLKLHRSRRYSHTAEDANVDRGSPQFMVTENFW